MEAKTNNFGFFGAKWLRGSSLDAQIALPGQLEGQDYRCFALWRFGCFLPILQNFGYEG